MSKGPMLAPPMANPQAVVDPVSVAVTPGREAATELRIRNLGSTEDRFRFQVRGDAGTWVSVTPFALSVGPGQEGTAQVVVRPPRTPVVPAGDHQVEISIRAAGDRTAEAIVVLKVAVAAFEEVGTRLYPDSSGVAGRFSLRVDNKGNAPVRATIAAAEGTPASSISATPPTVALEPGTGTEVQLEVASPRRLIATGGRPTGGRASGGRNAGGGAVASGGGDADAGRGGGPDGVGGGGGGGRPFSVTVTPDGSGPIMCTGSAAAVAMLSRRTALRLGGALVVLVVLAVVAALVLFPSSSPSKGTPAAATSASENCPGAGHLAHDANGQIRQTVLEPDNYSFLFENQSGCLPIRWNPCAPIHYVVNPSNANATELNDVTQAVAQVSQATGIQFIYDGTTTADSQSWQPYQPTAYPGRWAPVLIQWQHFGVQANIIQTAGDGLPIEDAGVYVSGIMGMNLDAHLQNNVPVPDGFGSGVTWGRVLLHELGHVVGLGHVTGVTEIMHEPVTEETSPTSAYGFGDLSGLRLLGRSQGCLTTPAPSSAANFKRSGAAQAP
ncbi:MAG: hypothetical protein ACRDZ8_04280 [Acidimicrobiales bacterium]